MILLDVSHTSHCPSNTGIQRVCRSLYRELQDSDLCLPVCYDPYLKSWRILTAGEVENLSPNVGKLSPTNRKSIWNRGQRLKGRWGRIFPVLVRGTRIPDKHFSGFLVPEIFSPKFPNVVNELTPRIAGPRTALFFDAIPIGFPEYTPLTTVRRFPRYLMDLLQFDGIAAISETSKRDLIAFWENNGVVKHPPVESIPLGTDFVSESLICATSDPDEVRPVILNVSTMEGRKNHLKLLEAAEALWSAGVSFELKIIGALNRETGGPAIDLLKRLRRMGRPVCWIGHVSENRIREEYRKCYFSIYPSLYEGFGLPILESLSYGKPCICSDRGALRERIKNGGCLVLSDVTDEAIAVGMRRLLEDRELYRKLASEAKSRKFRTWKEYSNHLIDWMDSLRSNTSQRM
ncbi:MAG: GDP-mannose-dependent alpha-(1-6)-phosphatidylinositol dimannoside mannosyltransferase [Candidatus Moanabacter tarae]|uniref:GDP-mannose-dependent alpha-(1-6)-phosphatidylinositol dimannoside mannosyltransferase n=1 Tax=Candidatus Moanibacter tarae TaxID=2200854 RepID=A0A2Z4AFV5_9BACT|nr:MAG: GDP-mannose-dependent alpha-(1-6)-phosphatidylinositol dimannoside mannosyltransferase [Candidatus Moanabacter tarae]